MNRRVVVVSGLAGLAAVLAAGAMLLPSDSDSASPSHARTKSAEVSVRDLTRTETLNGVVAYKNQRQLSAAQTGIITGLPTVGQELRSGDVVMSVDAQPVVLLTGPMPAWRDLGPGVDDGADVQQLEACLVALGFAKTSAGMPDQHWDWKTTNAVTAMQGKIGATTDGELDLGEVVFTVGDIHVAKLDGHVGGHTTPDEPVMTVQSTERVVIVELDPLDRDLVSPDMPVNVDLPTGTRAPGRTKEVSTTLQTNADGKNVFLVTIALDDPTRVKDIALAPVTVHYVTVVARGALSVPVSAIIGVPGGRYAVDVRPGDGGTRRVEVTLGAWGDGYVQVSGDLTAGMTVEVPT